MAIKEENGQFTFTGDDIYTYLKVINSKSPERYKLLCCDDFFNHATNFPLNYAEQFENKELGELVIKPDIFPKDGKECYGFEFVGAITWDQISTCEKHETDLAIIKLKNDRMLHSF